MYYRGVAVALVVYDVGDRASFECIGDWLKDVREKQQQRLLQSGQKDDTECAYFIIGNKCDIDEEDREVEYEEGEQWIKDYKEESPENDVDIKYLEVSAKEGTNINILFDEIAKKLLEKHVKLFGPLKQQKGAEGKLAYDLNQ